MLVSSDLFDVFQWHAVPRTLLQTDGCSLTNSLTHCSH